jgi:hypothetical protein
MCERGSCRCPRTAERTSRGLTRSGLGGFVRGERKDYEASCSRDAWCGVGKVKMGWRVGGDDSDICYVCDSGQLDIWGKDKRERDRWADLCLLYRGRKREAGTFEIGVRVSMRMIKQGKTNGLCRDQRGKRKKYARLRR